MSEAILQAVEIKKSYGKGHTLVNVLRGANLAVEEGELVTVVGPSGAGKSTFLHVLGGLDTPDGGEVLYRGESIATMLGGRLDVVRGKYFGFVFQFYHLLREFTALENVILPGMIRTSPLGWLKSRHSVRSAARDLLERLGLGERLTHRPNELSGGERQRVAIARALVGSPEVLLCDEPTGNLDKKTGDGIIKLLLKLNRQGQTMVVVTHDPQLAAMAHRTVAIAEGRIRNDSNGAHGLKGAQ